MARMFATKDPPIGSAEHSIFEALSRAEHINGWKVFYSHYVPVYRGEPREIDFIVVIPEYYCVICLEVKGGSFEIKDNGRWYTSRGKLLKESPHDQAQNSMYALKNYYSRFFRSLSIGCAVAFKDADKPTPALPIHLAKSIWSDVARDPEKLCETLKEIAYRISDSRLPSGTKAKRKAEEILADFQDELEPHNTLITKKRIFSSDLHTLRANLLALTNDQFKNLDLANKNPRCVIDGAAGTGKTVLAMELARQHCEEKKEKVALLCSNPYLSSRFRRWAKTLSTDRGGTVVAGTLEDFKQERFNYLIVDEAQNLCDEESLKSMGALLEGGLTDGRWIMFGDFTHQSITSPKLTETGDQVLERLQGLPARPARSTLEINCRNTYEIAAAFSMFVKIESPPMSGVHGPLIQIQHFKSHEQLHALLDTLVTDLSDREFYSRQIILLSSRSDDFSTVPPRKYGRWRLRSVKEAKQEKGLDIEEVPDVSGDSSQKTLRYSDIHDFQGLESEVVILVLPLTKEQTEVGGSATLPDYDYFKRVIYTGMSRAKAMLIIVAHESYKRYLDLKPRSRSTYTEHLESINKLVQNRDTNQG